MRKQRVILWIFIILFVALESFLLLSVFTMNRPLGEQVLGFVVFSAFLMGTLFWLFSLGASFFRKDTPHRWRDFFIVLFLNIFGAIYYFRSQQIQRYQPPKEPEVFNNKLGKWLAEKQFSLEDCIAQRSRAAKFGMVMGGLLFIVLALSFALKHTLFFFPQRLSPFIIILPMLALLVFCLKYIYDDWKSSDHIPFLLSLMFLQADASNRGKGMVFFDKTEPYYKKPSFLFIGMGDFFLFFSLIFGLSAFGDISDKTDAAALFLRTGGMTIGMLLLLIGVQFQAAWYAYFYPKSIFWVIKRYRIWSMVVSFMAVLPVLGFIAMYIMLSLQQL